MNSLPDGLDILRGTEYRRKIQWWRVRACVYPYRPLLSVCKYTRAVYVYVYARASKCGLQAGGLSFTEANQAKDVGRKNKNRRTAVALSKHLSSLSSEHSRGYVRAVACVRRFARRMCVVAGALILVAGARRGGGGPRAASTAARASLFFPHSYSLYRRDSFCSSNVFLRLSFSIVCRCAGEWIKAPFPSWHTGATFCSLVFWRCNFRYSCVVSNCERHSVSGTVSPPLRTIRRPASLPA